jgi:hypothetical protein
MPLWRVKAELSATVDIWAEGAADAALQSLMVLNSWRIKGVEVISVAEIDPEAPQRPVEGAAEPSVN